MALRFMYSGITGMNVNKTKLDVIGNNIANESTTAFKGSQARFKDMLYQNSGQATGATSTLGGTNAKQIGLGAQVSSISKMMGQGNALSTNRSLDVCIDGEGYLVVCKGPVDGTVNGAATAKAMSETFYTRDGNLTLDDKGNLLTSDGHRVMGYYLKGTSTGTNPANIGNSIAYNATTGVPTVNYVDPDAADLKAIGTALQPLAIPDTVATSATASEKITSFSIGKDGVILATLGSGKKTAIGQVAMASFKNPEGLVDRGGNFALNSANSGTPTYLTAKGQGTATAPDNSASFGAIIQGALEGSNVDLTEQFTDMITATRSFQASSKLISTGDEILQTITGLVR